MAVVEVFDPAGRCNQKSVYPGRDIAFWDEPYLPARNLVWHELRGFYSPVGIYAVDVEGFDDTPATLITVRLSSRSIETGASVAVMGIAAESAEDGRRRP